MRCSRCTSPHAASAIVTAPTTFRYEHLRVDRAPPADTEKPLREVPLYQVSFEVTNTGSRAGAAVAQVYVGERRPTVPRPPRELRGFARVELAPGETKQVSVPLTAAPHTVPCGTTEDAGLVRSVPPDVRQSALTAEAELGARSMSAVTVDVFASVLCETVKRALSSRDAKIAALEDRVLELKGQIVKLSAMQGA